jgi:hypothetical protein
VVNDFIAAFPGGMSPFCHEGFCVEIAKYEGKIGREAVCDIWVTKEEGCFGDASDTLAGVILILAPNNSRKLFTSY